MYCRQTVNEISADRINESEYWVWIPCRKFLLYITSIKADSVQLITINGYDSWLIPKAKKIKIMGTR